jgi:hypothetical protein
VRLFEGLPGPFTFRDLIATPPDPGRSWLVGVRH